MIPRRLMLFHILVLLSSCTILLPSDSNQLSGELTIGVVTYGETAGTIERYRQLGDYLAERLQTRVAIEPAYNEVQALAQIQRQAWSLVFAPPGLSAIAVFKSRYIPILPLPGPNNLRSVLVVQSQSPLKTVADLMNKSVALGKAGSATGYYLPLYDLYGLTLAEVRLTSTPLAILESVSRGEVAAGAVSKQEYDEFTIRQRRFPPNTLRILHTSRPIPLGAVLLSPQIDRNQQTLLEKALNEVPPTLAEGNLIPNTQAPDYRTLYRFIEKVKPIEANLQQKPAPLFN